jgi:phosphotransferase system HPr (HPr) family protein
VDLVNTAEATLEITNRHGLHLRAASTLIQAIKPFASRVTLDWDGKQANAKSVTSMLMLGAGLGSKLKVTAEGPDADEALEAIRTLFEQRFGED